MPLRRLVLRNVVDKDLQPPGSAAVVEVETEAADLKRLAPTLVLPGVDAGVELMKDLVVAREKRLIEDLGVTLINLRPKQRCRDHDAEADGVESHVRRVRRRVRVRSLLSLRPTDGETADEQAQGKK